MRVLPYFQSALPLRSPAGARGKARAAAPGGEGELQAQPVQAPVSDKFIPVSPVTGVVHSIKSEPVNEGNNASAVLKTGHYSFYSLNGNIEEKKAPERGQTLDLNG